MNTFEDLRAFQRALDLMVDVYQATERFPRQELYGLTSQLRRASTSIASNIAEGQGRLSFGEWRLMLSHARGSLYEVQAQLIASRRLGFLPEGAHEHLKKRIQAVARELSGLITWVKKREAQTKGRPRANSQTTDN